MSEPVPAEPGRSKKAKSVEIFEESRWGDSRLLGLFELQIRGASDELVSSGAPDWEDVLGDDDFDDDADLTDDEWAERDAARRAAEVAADEACGQADPQRRLTIDEAIALARTYSDNVTIWLDHEPWDASDPPRRDRGSRVGVWPPPNLDLRPRWHYESADASRHDHWWACFHVSMSGLTSEIARSAAESLPSIVSVRSAEAVRGGRGRANLQRDTVRLECLVPHTDERAADDPLELMAVLEDRVPDQSRLPWPIRMALLRDYVLRRHDSSFIDSESRLSVSHGVLGPAKVDDLP